MISLFCHPVSKLITVLIFEVVRDEARLQVLLGLHHTHVFSEPLLFHLVLQEGLIILVLCFDGSRLGLVEEVAILDILIMLSDVAFLTFLVVSEFFLVFGQSILNNHHRIVPVSEVFICWICPSFWL